MGHSTVLREHRVSENGRSRPAVLRRQRVQSRNSDQAAHSINATKLPWPAFIFLVSLIIPWRMEIGTLGFMTYRVVLIIMVVPCLLMWASGKAGRIRVTDLALLLYCAWCTLSLIMVHGADFATEPSGILFIETMGAYMLARCYIRSADDFLNMSRILFRVIVVLLPFAIIEAVTKRDVILELFGAIVSSYHVGYDGVRWGLRRVQGVFEHPIQFGVFAGSAFALAYLVLGYQRSLSTRFWRTGLIGATALLSLSAGPITAVIAQGLLIAWNSVLRSIASRWKILLLLLVAMYVLANIVSNQSVAAFYINTFAFDRGSAWQRLLIWEHGSASALRHPFFGVGFGDWERPPWMTSSVDMFWLIHAMKHGIPAALLFLVALLANSLGVSLKKGLDDRLSKYRIAYVIVMTGFFVVGWTVHFWAEVYVLFLFLLGSGVWLFDAPPSREEAAPIRGSRRLRSGADDSRRDCYREQVALLDEVATAERPDRAFSHVNRRSRFGAITGVSLRERRYTRSPTWTEQS